jgi:hypothetical protein
VCNVKLDKKKYSKITLVQIIMIIIPLNVLEMLHCDSIALLQSVE